MSNIILHFFPVTSLMITFLTDSFFEQCQGFHSAKFLIEASGSLTAVIRRSKYIESVKPGYRVCYRALLKWNLWSEWHRQQQKVLDSIWIDSFYCADVGQINSSITFILAHVGVNSSQNHFTKSSPSYGKGCPILKAIIGNNLHFPQEENSC